MSRTSRAYASRELVLVAFVVPRMAVRARALKLEPTTGTSTSAGASYRV